MGNCLKFIKKKLKLEEESDDEEEEGDDEDIEQGEGDDDPEYKIRKLEYLDTEGTKLIGGRGQENKKKQ